MFDIGFFKGQPTEYVIKYVSGRVSREGSGVAFFYLRHNTSIVAVPTTSMDANFLFNEITKNFQAVTLQGQFTYRIHNPVQAASLLNYQIDPRRRTYLSEDPQRLPQRIVNVIQMKTRDELSKRSLEETLSQSEEVAAAVLKRISQEKLLDPMGVELFNLYFQSSKPAPEVGKALEAEYREGLLKKADQAIYARRAAAVEEERKIKEKELTTQTALEEQRKQLIDLQGSNAEQEAEFRGKALEKEAEYRSRALGMQLGVYRSFDPRSILALAIKELGENAHKVGNLTITSEILAALFNDHPGKAQDS